MQLVDVNLGDRVAYATRNGILRGTVVRLDKRSALVRWDNGIWSDGVYELTPWADWVGVRSLVRDE